MILILSRLTCPSAKLTLKDLYIPPQFALILGQSQSGKAGMVVKAGEKPQKQCHKRVS
jgi:hypothetical protein